MQVHGLAGATGDPIRCRAILLLPLLALMLASAGRARANPTWIVYDRNGVDSSALVGDVDDRLAVLFTPPSVPAQLLKVKINTIRDLGTPLADHRFRIVDVGFVRLDIERTVLDGGAGWQEIALARDELLAHRDFYVQWWPVDLLASDLALAADSEPGGIGISLRSFFCPMPDDCAPTPLAYDFLIRVQVDDCSLYIQRELGCDDPILAKDGTGSFTVGPTIVDREGPIVNCALDQPLCEVIVQGTKNVDPASIAVNLQQGKVSGRLLDPTLHGELAIEAISALGPFSFEYTIQTDPDSDMIGNLVDNCPAWPNPAQADADGNGTGNDCECGDQDGNGRVDVRDLIAINLAIFNPALATPLCDTNFDGNCNVSDIVGANLRIFGAPAYCARNPPPAP